jgi:hypothetical protein
MKNTYSQASFYCNIPWKFRLIISLICCLGGVQLVLGETGIVAWKEQPFHADSSAKVFYFDRFEATGPITWFHQGGQRKGFEPGQAYDMVVLPGSLDELSRKGGSEELKNDFKKLSAFAMRYPAAKVMLKARLEQMRIYLENYEAAEVQVGGKWIPVSKDPSAQRDQEIASPGSSVGFPYLTESIAIFTVYLIILMLLTLRRQRTLILFFLLMPFLVGVGWLTYKQRGIGWVKEIPNQMRGVYERFGKK